MIFEEITTKLDLSGEHKLSESKVVHVNFGGDRMADTVEMPQPKWSPPQSTVVTAPVRRQKTSLWDSVDLRLPLILRLVAAVAVVALSLFFL